MNYALIDIHSHRPAPYPEGVISLARLDEALMEGQAYSAGIHPWDTAQASGQESAQASGQAPGEETFALLERTAAREQVVAIGECGVDFLKGGPLFRQLQILKQQIELSERLRKPLILHCVKGADIILGLRRDLKPTQPWAIHGFRGKPELAAQLTAKGIYLSFGEKFNAETVMQMPDDLILAETDTSVLTIDEIIGNLSVAANRDLAGIVRANTRAFFGNALGE